MTLEQIAAQWWTDGDSGHSAARHRLSQLQQSGWIFGGHGLARPKLPILQLGAAWHPGQEMPDMKRLSRLFRKRWKLPPHPCHVFTATQKSVLTLGGFTRGGIHNPCQLTHDIHVTELYLHYRRVWPELAASWVGEDFLAKSRKGKKVPDAALIDAHGQITKVVEFGGAYSAARLFDFHDACEQYGHSYEIW